MSTESAFADSVDQRRGPGQISGPLAPAVTTARRPRRLSRGAHRALLTTHVIASVGLLGAASSLLLLAVTGATADDLDTARSAYRFAGNSSVILGMPLSLTALFTGVALGLGTKWGVLRYPWVIAKLALLMATILIGALATGPIVEHLIGQPQASARWLLATASAQVLALLLSTALAIYKPGKRRRRSRAPAG